jgi:nucleolar GTP-binding protein
MAAVQADFKTELISMSTIEESGVSKVMGSCCNKLKEQRVDAKIRSKKVADVLGRITVAQPKARGAMTCRGMLKEWW